MLLGTLWCQQGCIEHSRSTTAPTSSCKASEIQLSSDAPTVGADGASGKLTVQPSVSCTWSAASDADWIELAAAPEGTGPGHVDYVVAPNPGGPRVGAIGVNGHRFEIAQDRRACGATLDRAHETSPDEGETFAVTVASNDGCAWTAVSHDSWITVTGGASGAGNGTVTVMVAANRGGLRTGTLTVAGQTFTVLQESGLTDGCTYAIAPGSQASGAAGGPGSTAVTAGGGCDWTAVSHDGWITVTSGASGTGNGTVTFTIAANSGAARTGTLAVGDDIFTVNQASGCTFAIAPGSQAPGAAGGAGSTDVTAGAGCDWNAVSNDAWITFPGASSGTGDGTLSFSVAANTGPARTGTLTVETETFTVNQAGGCTYGIAPGSSSPGVLGETGSVSVTAGAGCAWTAVSSNITWILVTSGGSGNGDGTVNYTVAPNATLAPRTGTITIGGQTFTINQAGI